MYASIYANTNANILNQDLVLRTLSPETLNMNYYN